MFIYIDFYNEFRNANIRKSLYFDAFPVSSTIDNMAGDGKRFSYTIRHQHLLGDILVWTSLYKLIYQLQFAFAQTTQYGKRII